MIRALLTLIFFATVANNALSHGEDKLGPHGGFIRMPGAFHTEIKETPTGVDVYLLDMSWKNPVTSKSKVTAELKRGSQHFSLHCEISGDRFGCALPENLKLLSGDRLIIKASREGAPGTPIEYAYPFKRLEQKHH